MSSSPSSPTAPSVLLAIFTIITCQFDFTTLVMATNPIQMYLYLMLVACVIKMRKLYPVEDRRKMGLTIMPGGKLGLYIMSASVIVISLLAIYVNGTDYFVTGFVVILGGLIAYLLCKWAYKGRVLDDPELYPLNPKTKLDLGDLMNVGAYMVLSGIMSLGAAAFLYLYERSYGTEYYLEEYGSGLFSNFGAMLAVCIGVGVLLLIAGLIMVRVGKNTEGAQLKELQAARKAQLDDMIREMHGAVPGETLETLDVGSQDS